MKIKVLIALLMLNEIAKAWWAVVAQPVLLGVGAILTALNQDVLDMDSIELRLPFINKYEEQEEKKDPLDDPFFKPDKTPAEKAGELHGIEVVPKEWGPGSRDALKWVNTPGIQNDPTYEKDMRVKTKEEKEEEKER